MPPWGHRPNSGPKSQWQQGETKTIRVPATLAGPLLDLAHELDRAGSFESAFFFFFFFFFFFWFKGLRAGVDF